MPLCPTNVQDFQFSHTFAPFAQGDSLPLPDVLTAEHVEQIVAEEQAAFGTSAKAFWTPALTLWAFLRQVLSADKSCRQAVAQVVMALALTREPADLDTAGYCRARAKLPVQLLQRLTLQVAGGLEAAAPESWLWKGRRVRLVDGSSSRLPDTPDNQQAFPQPKTQKAGLGFPLIRWVVLLSLATAALHGLAYGPYQGKETGETALFRELLTHLQRGDVVVADRYYCSYFLVALLRAHGVDVVFRLHQRRKYDFRRGQRLGSGDHRVTWFKPARPKWMAEALYAEIPATLTVREIRRNVWAPGLRVDELLVATTLVDAETYAADDVAELYQKRWQVELDIRTLKVTLGMDQLRCLTPFMIAKEIWAHCLAYNLVRKVAAQAASVVGVLPRSISFKAAKQILLSGWDQLTESADAEEYRSLATSLLQALGKEKVGNRPGRCEPRAIKGRPKPHKLLTEQRAAAKARLLKQRPSKKRRPNQARR